MARKDLPEINASSMADIAFLLLTFFLIATTLEKAEGIQRIVPNPDQPLDEDIIMHDRNVLRILVNQMGQIQIEGENAQLTDIKDEVIKHVNNGGGYKEGTENTTKEACDYCTGQQLADYSTHPGDAVIAIELDRSTPYNYFYAVENFIDQGYAELLDDYCKRTFNNKTYAQVKAEAEKEGASKEAIANLEKAESAYPKQIAKARLKEYQ